MWGAHPNAIRMQRLAAIEQMGKEAAKLLAEGYAVDADRVLDEMNERKRAWDREAA